MKRSFDNVVVFIERFAAILTILAFFAVPYLFSQGHLLLIYQIYICGINAFLTGYLYFLLKRKRYRYAAIPEYVHFVNHNVRDWLYELHQRAEKKVLREDDFGKDFNANTAAILDQIGNAFSHLTGVRCSVCIKELRPDRKVRVAFRDSLSAQKRSVRPAPPPHDIEKDTPCWAVYAKTKPDRWYGCNNVLEPWYRQEFKSASFELFPREPRVTKWLGYYHPNHWPLEFRSCLVVPIRYASCTAPPTSTSDGEWNYWGFLCVDSRHRNVFDFERMWPLAAAFADVLFVYFSRTFAIMRENTGTLTH